MYIINKRLAPKFIRLYFAASSTLEEGDVRLINDNDNTNMTGRLEVYHNGQWGTVCDEFFDSNVAMVVCRQLGFNPVGAMAVFRAVYGRGTGPVLVADARCTGSEENITSCSLSFTSSNFCYHYDGAGVICPCELHVQYNIPVGNYT